MKERTWYNIGNRGAFADVNTGNFTFVDGGQTYHSFSEIDGVKVIVRDKGAVKTQEFSHTANRIYAVVQDGKLKHLTFYSDDHKKR